MPTTEARTEAERIAQEFGVTLSAPAESTHWTPAHTAKLEEYRSGVNGPPLFNDHVITEDVASKSQIRHSEREHHRVMVLLKLEGYSNNEIAAATGYSPTTVSLIMRQPWAREMIVHQLTEHGQSAIRKYLESETPASLQTIVNIRDDENAPSSVRLAAADKILDRYLGKPVAFSEVVHKEPLPTNVEELQNQLQSLQAEAQRLKAN